MRRREAGVSFSATAASSQVVAEALGLAVPHSALAPSGQAVWLEGAVRAARAALHQEEVGLTGRDILTEASLHNAMVVHAAFGGSTNLLLHIPAIAHAAGLLRPTAQDWLEVNRATPRLVSVLPNGPEPITRRCASFWRAAYPKSCCTCATWDFWSWACSLQRVRRWATLLRRVGGLGAQTAF